jgi:hypothetical protein
MNFITSPAKSFITKKMSKIFFGENAILKRKENICF